MIAHTVGKASANIIGKWKFVSSEINNPWEDFFGDGSELENEDLGNSYHFKADGTIVGLDNTYSGKWRVSRDHLIIYDSKDPSEDSATIFIDADFLIEELTNKTMKLYYNEFLISIIAVFQRID